MGNHPKLPAILMFKSLLIDFTQDVLKIIRNSIALFNINHTKV